MIVAAYTKIENLWEVFYQSSASTDLVALPALLLLSASLDLWKQKQARQSSVSHNTDQRQLSLDLPAADKI
jgi:hypothetical protein